MLSVVCPVVRQDIESFKLMLTLLHTYLDLSDIDAIFIITPKRDQHYISSLTKKYFVSASIVSDEDIAKFSDKQKHGWTRQQILKLFIVYKIKSPFYLILDSDVICSKPFGARDLIKGGKGGMQLYSTSSHFKKIDGVCELMRYNKNNLQGEIMFVTPVVLSTDIVRKLLDYLAREHSSENLAEWLYNSISAKKSPRSWVTEYELYYIFAHKKGLIDKYHFPLYLLSDYSVWKISDVFKWDPHVALNDGSLFCVYQSTTKVPRDIVRDQVMSVIDSYGTVPLISCLMVTKYRLEHVKIAIDCFLSQTYPNKELVIVCDGNDGVQEYINTLMRREIKHIQLQPSNTTLGELRNISVDEARGEYVAQWDDDDWYHPSRLSIQYSKLKHDNGDICMLGRWTMAWPSENLYSISNYRKEGWEGTMLIKKKLMPRYSSLRKFEDTELINVLKKRNTKFTIIDEPGYHVLYLYMIHGNNTWDNEHFKKLFIRSEDIGEIYDKPEKLSEALSSLLGNRKLAGEKNYVSVKDKFRECDDTKTKWLVGGIIFMVLIFMSVLYFIYV